MWTTHKITALDNGRYQHLGFARSVLSSTGEEFFILSLSRAVPPRARCLFAHLTAEQKEVIEPRGDIGTRERTHTLLVRTPHGFRRYGSAVECFDKHGFPYFCIELGMQVPVDVRQLHLQPAREFAPKTVPTTFQPRTIIRRRLSA